jgi:hypothetical protein
MKLRSRRLARALLWLFLPCGASTVSLQPALAQAAGMPGTIVGSVQTTAGNPVAFASVELEGAGSARTGSDAGGAFRFAGVVPGDYTIVVVKAGFQTTQQSNVAVAAGSTVKVSAALVPASFSSLREIGRVVASNSRQFLDTSSAAVSLIPHQTFTDQGQRALANVLGETPGVVMTRSGSRNGASENGMQFAQIRGALAYETESLIDGHPVSIGASGAFAPLLLNPALLQDVEVVKGPGVSATEINAAIGGSVNYRTLEPTRVAFSSVDLGLDGYGGTDFALRSTGSISRGRLEYAVGLATDGTPGPLQNYLVAGSQVPLVYGSPPWTINGQALAGSPLGVKASNTPQYAGTVGAIRYAQPLYVCCSPLNTAFDSRAELAKLRFNFSEQSALTLSFLGGQALGDLGGSGAGSLTPLVNFSTFAPPPGYSGSVPAGTPIPFDTTANTNLTESQQQNLFQGEARSALGPTTVLARLYAGYANDFEHNFPLGSTVSFTENTWGGVPLCAPGTTFTGKACASAGGGSSAPVMQYFNGQPATFTTHNSGTVAATQDHFRGYSVELERPAGNAQLSLALDRSTHDSWERTDSPVSGVNYYGLEPGSSQAFTTILARAQLYVSPRFSTTLSNYAIDYSSHYTDNGGITWNDAVHAYDAPRLGLSWRPTADVAWRFGLGASIAPPYITLLSTHGGAPLANANGGATYYVLNTNNGVLSPETAFGYDLGLDRRISGALTFSGDLYLTNLRNMFLPQTFVQGTYTPATGADAGNTEPLYITRVANLGHSRFEGIEARLQSAPQIGLGFLVQGSLTRAFPYDLPPGFYSTASGPYTTNLAIIPNVNFQSGGLGYNGVSYGRIPYSQGYGELSFRTRSGVSYRAGVTYHGPNNEYNRPAFAVVSATVRVPIDQRSTWIELAGYNLTGAYDQPYYDYFGGTPVPLVNGTFGAKAGILGPSYGGNVGPPTVHVTLHHRFGAT